tara:strand:- start:1540 stop:2292 length:753 start_codon:yes stop_codon:yes gene_type:complete
MKLVDVHSHYTYKHFSKELDKVMTKMKSSDVIAITCGLDFKDNQEVLKITEKYDILKPALGIYPTEAGTLSDKELNEILTQIEQNKDKIVAISEVGLDHHWTKDAKKQARQKEVLTEIIKLANKINKPIIAHSRSAEKETVELLKQAKVPVVMHCFCGKSATLTEAINAGYYFSIPVAIVRSKTFRKLAKKAGIKRILTETDAPFLAPKPKMRNDSSNIKLTIEKLSKLLDLSEEKIADQIHKNYQKLFT